jgi:hypothetical protein
MEKEKALFGLTDVICVNWPNKARKLKKKFQIKLKRKRKKISINIKSKKVAYINKKLITSISN